jgi:prepilin-type N-terminal cleavage/methylation domain-containing protein
MRQRRGTSLVELMVVIVVLGSVAALTMQLLLVVFHASSRQHEEATAEFALSQWESSLRDDVHNAQKAEVEGNRLELILPRKERIVYLASARAVSRERLRLGGGQTQTVHREQFALPPGLSLIWRAQRADEVEWLHVELRPHDPQPPEGLRQPRIRRDVKFQIRVGRGQAELGETP